MSSGRRGNRALVGVVTSIMSPYRIPVFNALHEALDGRLRVFFLAAMAGRPWPVLRERIRFSYEVARGVSAQPLGRGTWVFHANVPLTARLHRANVGPVIVGGYNHVEFLWSLAHRRWKGQPAILWSESIDAAERRPAVRTALKRAAVQACDAFIVPGSRAGAQVRYLGAPPEQVFEAPNAVDLDFWTQDAIPRVSHQSPMRILFVGRLVPVKAPDLLLEALASPLLRDSQIDIVGSGRMRANLERQASDLGLRVTFHGELHPEQLRERYRDAEVLVLPSHADPWGLVLNEGMAAGCVPVASTAVGAVGDLVLDGHTGLVVPAGSSRALRNALEALARHPERRATLSAAALGRARTFSPKRCADGFVEALLACGWSP